MPGDEVQAMLADPAVASSRRHFERSWQVDGLGSSRLERLGSLAVEASVRLLLGSKFLFKSDMGSMRESLELRVPLLDEDLTDFGLSLPHHLRIEGRTGKRVLREVAARHVPPEIARRPKQGFSMPIDAWMDDGFRRAMRDELLEPSGPLFGVLRRERVVPLVEAFAGRTSASGLTQQALHDRILTLMALHSCLLP
jgi:asparagine synthase (glutamine-hydrolysing)